MRRDQTVCATIAMHVSDWYSYELITNFDRSLNSNIDSSNLPWSKYQSLILKEKVLKNIMLFL